MCLLGGFRFQLLVVLRFLYAELFVEKIVIDGQVEVPFQGGEDSHFGFRVRFLLLGETELSAGGIDAHYLENVGHVVVKHVQQETAIRLQLFVLHLLVYRAQGLCPGLGGFRGQRVAQYQFRYLAVATLAEFVV